MAVSVPTLGGQTIFTGVYPNRYKQYAGYRGGTTIMADGSMTTDLVNTSAKLRWELGWDWLTSAQVATLKTAVDAVKASSGTFTASTAVLSVATCADVSQVATLKTAVDAVKASSGTFVDVDGTSYTVTLDDGFLEIELEMKKIAGNNQRFATSIKLRQV